MFVLVSGQGGRRLVFLFCGKVDLISSSYRYEISAMFVSNANKEVDLRDFCCVVTRFYGTQPSRPWSLIGPLGDMRDSPCHMVAAVFAAPWHNAVDA